VPKQYPGELRERAVRLVAEHRSEYETEYAAIRSTAVVDPEHPRHRGPGSGIARRTRRPDLINALFGQTGPALDPPPSTLAFQLL
jgi:hypothetical protein